VATVETAAIAAKAEETAARVEETAVPTTARKVAEHPHPPQQPKRPNT
jgi:hypothetical protein